MLRVALSLFRVIPIILLIHSYTLMFIKVYIFSLQFTCNILQFCVSIQDIPRYSTYAHEDKIRTYNIHAAGLPMRKAMNSPIVT